MKKTLVEFRWRSLFLCGCVQFVQQYLFHGIARNAEIKVIWPGEGATSSKQIPMFEGSLRATTCHYWRNSHKVRCCLLDQEELAADRFRQYRAPQV